MKNIPVDYARLKSAISKKGLSLAAIARELGHCDSYFNDARNTGLLKPSIVKQLEILHGIKYDEYKPVEPETQAVPATEVVIDYNALREMVQYAVTEALKGLIADKQLQTTLYNWLVTVNKDGWRIAWREQMEAKNGTRMGNH